MESTETDFVIRAAQDLAIDPTGERDRATLIAAGIDGVSALVPLLQPDRPIVELEGIEDVLKTVLLAVMTGPMDGARARRIAQVTRELGLLYKYKSYAAKCSTPLGYSVFLQSAGQGFSFQRHVTRKIEIFHIVEVLAGALVFVAPYDAWERLYDPERFGSWLHGTSTDPALDRFRITPQPGDVYVINECNVVHTVLGCVLEEFATVSTDLVDRLFDQNGGLPIPPEFTRAAIDVRLRTVAYPAASQFVSEGGVRHAVVPQTAPGETIVSLSDGRLFAQRRMVSPGQATGLGLDEERARAIHVTAGAGGVVLAGGDELGDAAPSLPVSKGDVFLVPAGVYVGFVGGARGLEVSEQRVSAADSLAG